MPRERRDHRSSHPFSDQDRGGESGQTLRNVMLNHAGIYSRHSAIYGVPNLGKRMNPVCWRLFHFAMDRALGPEVNQLRMQVGLPPVEKIAERVWISKRLNLIAVTSAICGSQPDWPACHNTCGVFTLPNEAEAWAMPDDLKRFLGSGPPPVHITPGSILPRHRPRRRLPRHRPVEMGRDRRHPRPSSDLEDRESAAPAHLPFLRGRCASRRRRNDPLGDVVWPSVDRDRAHRGPGLLCE
jgi:hypothetical protein